MDNLLQALINADRVCKEVQEYFDSANELDRQKQIAWRKSMVIKKFLAILAPIPLIFLMAFLGDFLADLGWKIKGMTPLIVFWGFVIVDIIVYHILKSSSKAKLSKEIQEQCGAIRLQGQNALESNKDALSFLPTDYWYPLATSFMVKTVQAGRATTLPEAIDKLEEQLHRWRLEEANAQILAQQQAQSQQLAEIAQGISGVRSDIIWSNL